MRQCGSCSMCCKLLHVKEIEKPAGHWCINCENGCKIYSIRPKSCQDFECMWLQEESMPDNLRPDKSKVVIWVTPDGKTLLASVDPAYPFAYKEGEMGLLLQSMLQTKDAQIGIIVGKEKFPLLPEITLSRETEYYGESGEQTLKYANEIQSIMKDYAFVPVEHLK